MPPKISEIVADPVVEDVDDDSDEDDSDDDGPPEREFLPQQSRWMGFFGTVDIAPWIRGGKPRNVPPKVRGEA